MWWLGNIARTIVIRLLSYRGVLRRVHPGWWRPSAQWWSLEITKPKKSPAAEDGAEVAGKLRPARPEPSHGWLRLRPRPARSRQSIRLGVPTNPVIPSPPSFLWMPVSLQGISMWICHPTPLRTGCEPGKKRRASTHTISEGSHDPGLSKTGCGQGRLGCSGHPVAPLSSGIVRPVESAVKRPRRHTKARCTWGNCGPWHYYRLRSPNHRGSSFR